MALYGVPVYGGEYGAPSFPKKPIWGSILSVGFEDVFYQYGELLTSDIKVRVRYSQALIESGAKDLQIAVDGVLYDIKRVQANERQGRRRYLEILGSRAFEQTRINPDAATSTEALFDKEIITPEETVGQFSLKPTDTREKLNRIRRHSYLNIAQEEYQRYRPNETEAQLIRRLYLDPWFNSAGPDALPDGPYASSAYFDVRRPYGPLTPGDPLRPTRVRKRYFPNGPTIISVYRPKPSDPNIFRIELDPVDEEAFPTHGYLVQYRRIDHPFDVWSILPKNNEGAADTRVYNSATDSTDGILGNRDDHWPLYVTDDGDLHRLFWRRAGGYNNRTRNYDLQGAYSGGNPAYHTRLEFRAAAYVRDLLGEAYAGIASPWSPVVQEHVRLAVSRSLVFPEVLASGITFVADRGGGYVNRPAYTIRWDKVFPADSIDGYDVQLNSNNRIQYPLAYLKTSASDQPFDFEVVGNEATPLRGRFDWQREYQPYNRSIAPFRSVRMRTYRYIDDGTLILKYTGEWSDWVPETPRPVPGSG